MVLLDVIFVGPSHSTHLSSVSCPLDFQSAELLNSKLPRWQNTCGDATRVPEEVIHMIEEIKTPLSTPASWTPQPSPAAERSSMVGAGRPWGPAVYLLSGFARRARAFVSGDHGPPLRPAVLTPLSSASAVQMLYTVSSTDLFALEILLVLF